VEKSYTTTSKIKSMEKKDILERVINLVNPKLHEAVNSLEVEEYDYFIEHLTLDLESSLRDWQFKTTFKI
jgi:hypothetical protein